MLRSRARFAGLAALVLLLANCAAPPPPPPPTIVNLTLKGAADVNPTVAGTAAPVQLRIYQLTSLATFEGAEFFALLERDQATLADQLVRREDFLMAPGQTRTTAMRPEARVAALGMFIAVRSTDGVTWRANLPVPPNQTTNVTVDVGRGGITVTAAP